MEFIILNVGGVLHTTTRSTLISSSEFFDALLNGDFAPSLDADGNIFIDRDGDVFHDILSFMRTGSPVQSKFSEHILTKEAEYFLISGLTKIKAPLLPPAFRRTDNVKLAKYTSKSRKEHFVVSHPDDITRDVVTYYVGQNVRGVNIEGLKLCHYKKKKQQQDLTVMRRSTRTVGDVSEETEYEYDADDVDDNLYYSRTVFTQYADPADVLVFRNTWDSVELITLGNETILKLMRYEY
jgi:hypothetical protein